MFNAANVRLDSAMINMITTFQRMFGAEFLSKNTIVEFTHWPHGLNDYRRRGERTMEEAMTKLNESLRSEELLIWNLL